MYVAQEIPQINAEIVQKGHFRMETKYKIRKALSAKESVFNNFTHEKEISTSWLKLATAEKLADDKLIFSGFTGILIPKNISHVLRVCIIAEMKSRASHASSSRKISEKEPVKLIHDEDEDRAAWINNLYKKNDPWDSSLCDLVIPMDKMDQEKAVSLIVYNAGKDVIKPTARSGKAADDFLIAAKVEMHLAREGHIAGVRVKEGGVTITIHKRVLLPVKLEEEFRSIAAKISGVRFV
ncbi:MAG: response regulator, partial [Desulfobacteraceae bacterium]